MRFFKWYAVLLIIISAQTIAGCGGGGGSTGTGIVVTPPVTDTTPPIVNFFSMPVSSTSLTVAISSLNATDAVGVIGYLVTESAIAPLASAAGWSMTAPTSFTFSATGSRTAYVWAKDAAGNVSVSYPASVTISTTKTAKLMFSSQSTNSNDLIGGFLLTVMLPEGSVLQVDSSGNPLSSAVYLSGEFDGSTPQINVYDGLTRELTVSIATTNGYFLGEFMTVVVTVPSSYVPNINDIAVFNAFTPITGVNMPSVSASLTFI